MRFGIPSVMECFVYLVGRRRGGGGRIDGGHVESTRHAFRPLVTNERRVYFNPRAGQAIVRRGLLPQGGRAGGSMGTLVSSVCVWPSRGSVGPTIKQHSVQAPCTHRERGDV